MTEINTIEDILKLSNNPTKEEIINIYKQNNDERVEEMESDYSLMYAASIYDLIDCQDKNENISNKIFQLCDLFLTDEKVTEHSNNLLGIVKCIDEYIEDNKINQLNKLLEFIKYITSKDIDPFLFTNIESIINRICEQQDSINKVLNTNSCLKEIKNNLAHYRQMYENNIIKLLQNNEQEKICELFTKYNHTLSSDCNQEDKNYALLTELYIIAQDSNNQKFIDEIYNFSNSIYKQPIEYTDYMDTKYKNDIKLELVNILAKSNEKKNLDKAYNILIDQVLPNTEEINYEKLNESIYGLFCNYCNLDDQDSLDKTYILSNQLSSNPKGININELNESRLINLFWKYYDLGDQDSLDMAYDVLIDRVAPNPEGVDCYLNSLKIALSKKYISLNTEQSIDMGLKISNLIDPLDENEFKELENDITTNETLEQQFTDLSSINNDLSEAVAVQTTNSFTNDINNDYDTVIDEFNKETEKEEEIDSGFILN